VNTIIVNPGDVVVSEFGSYQHWSIVSDKLCHQGKYMLISATKRTGTVKEEPWDIVTNGKRTYVTKLETNKSISEILFQARSQIDKWKYSVVSRNCEHFAKWSSGLKFSSSQVNAGVGGAIIGGVGVAALSENPSAVKILGGMVLIAGLAVLGAKAIDKYCSNITD
jgi:hypothetical protein